MVTKTYRQYELPNSTVHERLTYNKKDRVQTFHDFVNCENSSEVPHFLC